MVSKWLQWPAMLVFAFASLRFGIPRKATAAAKFASDPTWASHIDYFQLAWPGWVGFAIAMVWMMMLMAPQPKTEVDPRSDGHARSSQRLNRPGR